MKMNREEKAAAERHEIGVFERGPRYATDTRTTPPDMFVDLSETAWDELTWERVKRPYTVEKWARAKRDWERENGDDLPVQEGWKLFNASFHHFFAGEPRAEGKRARRELRRALLSGDIAGAGEAWDEMVAMFLWNRVHRVEDAVWDPRGKRALFEGLDLKKPRILFLGAADGYEAMQLCAMYPGAEAVLVDYDDFCRTERFGKFPERYPFLGADPATGGQRVWYRQEMNIEFVVEDLKNLDYGAEFDLVVSVGLVEHFPDEYKPVAYEAHRKYLKPGGYAIVTTPRNQLRSRAFYHLMANWMNFGYRELMDVRQLGLYTYENGFDILRAGVIKAHNGLICRPR